MNKRHVLMIADHVPYVKYVTSLNADVTLFQLPHRAHLVDPQICESVHFFSFRNVNLAISLAEQIHNIHPFDAVFSFTEEGVELASIIANHLNLVNNPIFTVQAALNKANLRTILNEKGISVVKFIQTNELLEGIEFAYSNSYPLVLKPSCGSGSKGIFIVQSDEDFVNAFKKVQLIDDNNLVLIEEFLDGPEFSVESISFDGKHHIITITDKKIMEPNCVEVGHSLPSIINKEIQQSIEAVVLDVLNVLKVEIGPTHIEVKLTSKGPKIVEAHTRPGGDFIAYMVENALGIDMLTLSAKKYLGIDVDLPEKADGGAAVRYFQFTPGVVVSIEGLEKVKSDPNVIWVDFSLETGDSVSDIVDSHSRNGCVVTKCSNVKEAINQAERLVKELKVVTRS
ncbi:ATP-grasp domain-containing protein [Paenibacillus polymyxa]|uniref:ATP-grasp domain-containing protein n=1 Tax=Paenibacillus polymyxa TaxID=1406 RepID=UPI00307EC582